MWQLHSHTLYSAFAITSQGRRVVLNHITGVQLFKALYESILLGSFRWNGEDDRLNVVSIDWDGKNESLDNKQVLKVHLIIELRYSFRKALFVKWTNNIQCR